LLIPFSERLSNSFCELEVVAMPEPRVERTPGKTEQKAKKEQTAKELAITPGCFIL
jgi:hypothetical protein